MTITFTQLLDDIEYQLGYAGPGAGYPEAYWERSLHFEPWAKAAILAFPLLRPDSYAFTLIIEPRNSHIVELPEDFRVMVSVEYPASQLPPVYLTRLSYQSPEFYGSDSYYDIERNFTIGKGYQIIFSKELEEGDHAHLNYLVPHDADLMDNGIDELTIQDEYEDILIAYVIARAYRHLMTLFVCDPSAHENTISELTEMIKAAEDKYNNMIKSLTSEISIGESWIIGNRKSDKHDRVY